MSHYFSKRQETEFRLKQIEDCVRGINVKLFTAPGVFSKKKIDNGSRLLAKKMIIGEKDKVLDLGCGIGIIGLIASHLTKGKVVLTDINKRACKLARMNTKRRKNTSVVSGDAYGAVKGLKFDVILLNPPQSAGRELCFKLISEAKEHLTRNGSLQMVARHKKGGEVLSFKMKEIFGNLETLARGSGYRVYMSKNLP